MRYPVESSVGGVRGAGGSRRARLEWRNDEGFSRAFARDASVCCRGWSAALLVGFAVSWACSVGSLFRSSSEEDRNRVESCPSGVCCSARARARSRWQRVAFAACRLIEMEMVAVVRPKKRPSSLSFGCATSTKWPATAVSGFAQSRALFRSGPCRSEWVRGKSGDGRRFQESRVTPVGEMGPLPP